MDWSLKVTFRVDFGGWLLNYLCGLLPQCGWLLDLKKPFDVDIEVDVVGHLALGNHLCEYRT